MSLKEVEVHSGGRAWVRTRLSHERAVAKRALFMAVVPTRSLRRVQEAQARGELVDRAAILAGDDVELADAIRAMAKAQAETIRLCVQRWDNVHGPDGDPLTFPEDVEQLDDEDFDALYAACENAIAEGRADPNAGGAPSPSSSPQGSSPTAAP